MPWKWVLIAVCFIPRLCWAGDTLETVELAQLRQYIGELRQGRPGSAVQVENLADVSFAGLREVMQSYAELDGSVEPATHRAFQALLERTSRTALLPWPMITLYSPEFADFLAVPAGDSLSRGLFARLMASGGDRRSFDLIVRLTSQESLAYLNDGEKRHRIELLEAWNCRLARGSERRPIPMLDESVAAICESFSIAAPPSEREAHFKFIAFWPSQRKLYDKHLAACLESADEELVLLGLAAHEQSPRLLELNAPVIRRFLGNEKVLAAALRNYAFDANHDHSGVLRELWQSLQTGQTKARYAALFAMSVHPHGNDTIALAAVLDNAYELLDVALPVLAKGDPKKARQAIEHVLSKSERGREEALRLATALQLTGFENQAARLALNADNEQILRQTAMLYLRSADGAARRPLLSLLNSKSNDLRLTAIQMFGLATGLTADDMNVVGPELIRVALQDPSQGHQQEAIYALGNWRAALAKDFFRKLLADNPAVVFTEGHYNDALYWQYRFRLMALLGLAKLGDAAARTELVELHRRGTPIERMDALLAFLDLGGPIKPAWEDLTSVEPKLVATAVALIEKHGDEADRERLRKNFSKAPLWQEFLDSGLDDHNILRTAGVQGGSDAP